METGPKRDLEQRTERFAAAVREFLRGLPESPCLEEDIRQLLRSSGSVGANYIEAQESLGKKDFLMHIKICRKEAKESGYWLRLLRVSGNDPWEAVRTRLVQEAKELTNIFGAIFRKME